MSKGTFADSTVGRIVGGTLTGGAFNLLSAGYNDMTAPARDAAAAEKALAQEQQNQLNAATEKQNAEMAEAAAGGVGFGTRSAFLSGAGNPGTGMGGGQAAGASMENLF
ncbi:MAG: hypothetical protein KGJ13_02390 [Patescibacteria group bacterium]|nr:hypothetical protein [Patescibacteria group bacterium]